MDLGDSFVNAIALHVVLQLFLVALVAVVLVASVVGVVVVVVGVGVGTDNQDDFVLLMLLEVILSGLLLKAISGNFCYPALGDKAMQN